MATRARCRSPKRERALETLTRDPSKALAKYVQTTPKTLFIVGPGGSGPRTSFTPALQYIGITRNYDEVEGFVQNFIYHHWHHRL